MNVCVDAPVPAMAAQIEQLSRFYLAGLDAEAGEVRISLTLAHDRLGSGLHQCQVVVVGGPAAGFAIEETHADPVRAATRALARTVRAVHRRLVPGPFRRLA